MDFILPLLWPANCSDLNPVDYVVWGILQDSVYRNQIPDMEELCQCIEKWDSLYQRVIDSAIKKWRKRLRSCIGADGEHFENAL